jgi:hypothetical protein
MDNRFARKKEDRFARTRDDKTPAAAALGLLPARRSLQLGESALGLRQKR